VTEGPRRAEDGGAARRQGATDWLFSLETLGIKFGLDNITALVDALGRPDRAFKSVHIAGTNGKGSVTAMVDAALRAAGHRSARYTSPHLIELPERFVVDGHQVTADALDSALAAVRRAAVDLMAGGRLEASPTFFEVATAAAFELFRRAAVEVAVCEVGLGGRLDATNVLAPMVTAITSIGRDHQQHLGDTLPQIAFEKAGIVKRGTPVVVGPVPPEALDTIAGVARECGAAMIRSADGVVVASDGREPGEIVVTTPEREYRGVRLALRGRHQLDNAVVAIRVLELLDAQGVRVPEQAVVAGLRDVSWPGRLDVRRLPDGREALLDAAHNVDGALSLAEYARDAGWSGSPLVFAAMADKDFAGMLRALAPGACAVVTTRASNPRSADPQRLAAAARVAAPDRPIIVEPSAAAALDAAWALSPRIIVAGSIFLLGDVMKRFPPA
jgi:dihydrofolate synthase/folylpolyglutamate synthase